MSDLNRDITTCNILAYTRRYVSLLHIAEVILNFDSDIISTTMEAQPEWDCKVPVSSKRKEGLDIYCAAFGHSSGECGTPHVNTETELPVKKLRIGQDTSQTQYTVSPVGYVEEHGYTYTASLCTMNSSIPISSMSVQFMNL